MMNADCTGVDDICPDCGEPIADCQAKANVKDACWRWNDDRPLAARLRGEAAEWDDGETIAPLLLEAAEAIEHLAARVAELEYERR